MIMNAMNSIFRKHNGRNTKGSRRGATMVEFTLLGVPALFLCMSVVMTGIGMWQFFTLSYAATQTARFASMHGNSCTQNGNTCQVTRADVATYFQAQALALSAGSTVLTMTDGSGAITCNPVTSCPSGTSKFPSNGNNAIGSNITIIATYPVSNPLFMYWPGAGKVNPGTYTVGARSTQEILY
jgi:Flp pilus assembly protein TadG